VLTTLLPGLRDLRTPLAVGYLWIVVLWLITNRWVPRSVQQATGPIKSLYEFGAILGGTVVLAALTFVAYLIGSILSRQKTAYMSRIVRLSPETGFKAYLWFLGFGQSGERLFYQLRVVANGRLTDIASNLKFADHVEVLGSRYQEIEEKLESLYKISNEDLQAVTNVKPASLKKAATSKETQRLVMDLPDSTQELLVKAYEIETSLMSEIVTAYAQAIADELNLVGSQLQAKNRDLWDTYDRQLAEAQFRRSIVLPLALIFVLLAALSGHPWWLLLLVMPIVLFILSRRYYLEAASTLIQALQLKMVEPPVLERLRQVVADKKATAKVEEDQLPPTPPPGSFWYDKSVTEQAPASPSPTENG
jgi:hypothetical protein